MGVGHPVAVRHPSRMWPDTLLCECRAWWEKGGVREGERAELFRLLIYENDITVAYASNDLKGHWDIFGGSNLRHCVEGSRSSIDDQKTGHTGEELIRRRSMLVHMVPVGAGRMSSGGY